jgi:hypothetical protein
MIPQYLWSIIRHFLVFSSFKGAVGENHSESHFD